MGLFGSSAPSTLEDVLGQQAKNQIAGIQDNAIQNKRRLVAQEAHSGRLMSGVSDYPLADLSNATAGAEGDVYSNLARSLAQIPAEDQFNQNEYNRNMQLADLIGSLNKPSSLQEALGALRSTGGLAATIAALA